MYNKFYPLTKNDHIHSKYNYICQYCGFDGRCFSNWLQLTIDHIKPTSQGGSDDDENLITACKMCNTMTANPYVLKDVKDKTIEEIFEIKKEYIKKSRREYFKDWKINILTNISI